MCVIQTHMPRALHYAISEVVKPNEFIMDDNDKESGGLPKSPPWKKAGD